MNKSPQQRATLRVCASCEWIFRGKGECPICEFGSYGARYVYGNQCYQFEVNQKPWFEKRLLEYAGKLQQIIEQNKPAQRKVRKLLGVPGFKKLPIKEDLDVKEYLNENR